MRTIDLLEPMLPSVTRETLTGAGHVPQLEMPAHYLTVTRGAIARMAV